MYSVFSQVMTHTSAFCSVGDMSVGRQQAFEIFKRDYHENQQIEGNKNQLRQKYAREGRHQYVYVADLSQANNVIFLYPQ